MGTRNVVTFSLLLLVIILLCTHFTTVESKKTEKKKAQETSAPQTPQQPKAALSKKVVAGSKIAAPKNATVNAPPLDPKKAKKIWTDKQKQIFELTKCLIKNMKFAKAMETIKVYIHKDGRSSIYVKIPNHKQIYVMTNSPFYVQFFAHDRRMQWLSFGTLSHNTVMIEASMDGTCDGYSPDVYESAIVSLLRTELGSKYRSRSPQSSQISVCKANKDLFRQKFSCSVVKKKVKIPAENDKIKKVKVAEFREQSRVDFIWMIYIAIGMISVFSFWVFLSGPAIEVYPVQYWPQEKMEIDRVFPVFWGPISMIRNTHRTDTWPQILRAFFVYYIKTYILSLPMIWASSSILLVSRFSSLEILFLVATHGSILVYASTFFWLSQNPKIENFLKVHQDTCSVYRILSLYYRCLKYENPSSNIGMTIMNFVRDLFISLGMFVWLAVMSVSISLLLVCTAAGILTNVKNFALLIVIFVTGLLIAYYEGQKVEAPMHRVKKVVLKVLLERRKKKMTALANAREKEMEKPDYVRKPFEFEDVPLSKFTYLNLYEMLNVLDITPSQLIMKRIPYYPVSLGFMVLMYAVLTACQSGLEIAIVLNLAILILIRKRIQVETADSKNIYEMRLTILVERWIYELEHEGKVSNHMKEQMQEMRKLAIEYGASSTFTDALLQDREGTFL